MDHELQNLSKSPPDRSLNLTISHDLIAIPLKSAPQHVITVLMIPHKAPMRTWKSKEMTARIYMKVIKIPTRLRLAFAHTVQKSIEFTVHTTIHIVTTKK